MAISKQLAFSSLQLPDGMHDNLSTLGYEQMTQVQADSLPAMLAGRDMLAQAKTGSGKTAAFGISLLAKLQLNRYRVQVLVLCPTRELADQVSKELRRLARFTQNIKILTLCGGKPLGPQIGSLEHGAHIVVGTPGRIAEHLRKRTLKLNDVHTLVLDEADRMLDMGFRDAIAGIVETIPLGRQTLMFSATYPDDVLAISRQFQQDPLQVRVESVHSEEIISQHFYKVKAADKPALLVTLLSKHYPDSTVIFCNTKRDCQSVADALNAEGFVARALHGDMDQRDRDLVLVQFSNSSCPILVATDVAARGLDVKSLKVVVNYDLARDPEVHVHRIGRTGRAGEEGKAINFYEPGEAFRLEAIESYSGVSPRLEKTPAPAAVMDNPVPAPMVTLCIDGGRKDRLRPGDILGALTGDGGLPGSDIGKIDIFDFRAYVAVARKSSGIAYKSLREGKIKGRSFKVRKLS